MKHPELKALVVSLAAALALPGLAFASLDAREIMQRVEDRDDGDYQTSDMEMILIDKNDNRRIRNLRSFSRDQGEDTQSIVSFTSAGEMNPLVAS